MKTFYKKGTTSKSTMRRLANVAPVIGAAIVLGIYVATGAPLIGAGAAGLICLIGSQIKC